MKPITCAALVAIVAHHLFHATKSHAADSSAFSATIALQLDKPAFAENESISGVIRFRLTAPSNWPLHEKPSVIMNGPHVSLDTEDDLSVVPIESRFDSVLTNPVKLGHDYIFRFQTVPSASFVTNVQRAARSIPVFAQGRYRLLARITSPELKSPWNSPPGGLRADWTGTFVSESQTVVISSAGCSSLKRPEILAAIESSYGEQRESLTKFFHAKGQILTADLPEIISKAEGWTKGRLAEFYKSAGGGIKGLSFFEHPRGNVNLNGHTNAPFFLKLAPKEEVRFVYVGPSTVNHNVNGLEQNYTTLAKPLKITRAPAAPGLYRMVCDIHSTPWGWVLVVDGEGVPSDAGRPPNRIR